MFCCSIRFRTSGLIWGENLKNWQNIPKSEDIPNSCCSTLTAYISGKIAPHTYVSYIFGNVLISSFNWSTLNWSFDIKITNILRFEKKCRLLVKSLYFGPDPIVNEVIWRFWAVRSNFLYDFTWLTPNLYEIMNKMPVLALKWTFWFRPPPGLNLDLNLTPPHMYLYLYSIRGVYLYLYIISVYSSEVGGHKQGGGGICICILTVFVFV